MQSMMSLVIEPSFSSPRRGTRRITRSVKLAKTGPVLLSGDLYHYPEERQLHRVPTTEFNAAQTTASRAAVDAFLKDTCAQLWIQRDFIATARLQKSLTKCGQRTYGRDARDAGGHAGGA